MAKLGQVAVHAFAPGAAAVAILIGSVVAEKRGWGSGRPQVEA